MIKEGDHDWGVPGGGIDHGEDVVAALAREINEELNVAVASTSKLPVVVNTFYDSHKGRHKLWLVYDVTLAGEPQLGADSTALDWFYLNDIPQLNLDKKEDVGILELVRQLRQHQ